MITQIKKDLFQAIKNKEDAKKSTLRLLWASLEKEKVNFKLSEVTDLTQDQVMTVINRSLKELDREIESFKSVGYAVDSQLEEKETLKKYLPKQLTVDEIKAEVVHALDLVDKGELADVNKAKGYLAQKLKGKADMKQVIQILMQKSKK